MGTAIRKYAEKIREGKAKLIIPYSGEGEGIIVDPESEDIPLDILSFGIFDLDKGPFTVETGDREYVLVLEEGYLRLETEGKIFHAERKGGPFSVPYGVSNASCIYVGRESRFRLEGKGEVIFYSAPAYDTLPPFFVAPGTKSYVSRGVYVWRRDVITLVECGKETTNLTVGETYSSPGLWSGTPIHVHDYDDPEGKESDHEEVYYHISRYPGKMGSYPVQLLFSPEEDIWLSFIVPHRTIVVLPGGCHPVVASPVSDIIYGWGMADKGKPPVLRDLSEFIYLREIEKVWKDLKSLDERGREKVMKLLSPQGREMFEVMLREYQREE